MGVHRQVQHWIGGEWVGSVFDGHSINPATGEVIGAFADGGKDVAESAIQAAAQAFKSQPWRVDPMLRAAALSHMADAYAARLPEVIDTLCLENGKVRYEASFEANFIIRALRYARVWRPRATGAPMTPSPASNRSPSARRWAWRG